ncbi:ankyrin repeat domain-containing protein [Wolbachia endosymbiont (group B) of Villa cingulata]|uniref:ankyrin repeat domain-containing protein n=1 Tax=Wolbachia endosymbiont (group B) of Villa cingulata TaxID=3066157 RepID=UPI00333F203F
MEKGADVNVKNNNGQIPLDIARSRGYSQIVEFLSSYQHESRNRRDIVPSNSWMNNSVVSWVKGLISSTGSPALLTSRGHNSTTVTSVPEINYYCSK